MTERTVWLEGFRGMGETYVMKGVSSRDRKFANPALLWQLDALYIMASL